MRRGLARGVDLPEWLRLRGVLAGCRAVKGPEHYTAAEALLDLAEAEPETSHLTAYYVGAAQVHATLAQVAALAAVKTPGYDGVESLDDGYRRNGWFEAIYGGAA